MERLTYIAREPGRLTVTGVPGGYDAYLAAEAAQRGNGLVVLVATEELHAAALVESIRFFAPDLAVRHFPAWDCLPYDRMSPKSDIESERLATLAALTRLQGAAVVVTVVNALLQRVPPRAAIESASFHARIGKDIGYDKLTAFLAANGYVNASTVREPGDFALRGGIVDLWPPGSEQPLRLDFFGPTLEAIRRFDAETQLSGDSVDEIELLPASETPLDAKSISRFRAGYVARFGPASDDPLYEAVSAGRKAQGMEHWLPLFHETLETLFDYAPKALFLLSHQSEEAKNARLELFRDYYAARKDLLIQKETDPKHAVKAPPYKPLPPEQLYLTDDEWKAALERHRVRDLSPFQAPESKHSVDAGARPGRDFAPERKANANVFEAAVGHIKALDRKVLVGAWSEGSVERLGGVLSDHGLKAIRRVKDWPDALKLAKGAIGIACLSVEHGFEAQDFAVVSEQDILGDRMVRPSRHRRAQNFLQEASSLAPGDLVTHIEHGVGRYLGLKTIDAAGAPHDCLELQYDGGKLFLPVENIELLTRYGADEGTAQLDRLGGAGWQTRKAKMRERVREMAAELIRIAAARELKALPATDPPQGVYDEFCARFPYQETEDQEKAIADTIEDLAKGRPMDRLVCGDVGFGKTEVALRAAFVVAMSGQQVAVVVPTT
ncbi:MAG: transcription-repair coupling factor, partial [Alphaproteobacteria bacterium]|nr:transcription-repair coupling factor [Alphaproteobacteria bacterium]